MVPGSQVLQRSSSQTYPSPMLTMLSPATGAVEVAGVSPLSVTMQITVGMLGTNDWGTLTGWCISWGDGTESNGVFGSPSGDSEGFLYTKASATHSYTNYDDPATSQYFSRGYRPRATVGDTTGNAIATDYGTYIYPCRIDAVPDLKSGGCGYPIKPEPVAQPPGSVCADSDPPMCITTAKFACVGGTWSLQSGQDEECRNKWDGVIPPPQCVENNVVCRENVIYKCTSGTFKATGTACVTSPEEPPIIDTPIIDIPVVDTPFVDNTDTIMGLPKQTAILIGAALIGGFILFGGK